MLFETELQTFLTSKLTPDYIQSAEGGTNTENLLFQFPFQIQD